MVLNNFEQIVRIGHLGLTLVADGSDSLEEVIVTAQVGYQLAILYMQDLGREFTDKMNIVADEDEVSLVGAEG
jgi:hypothetical protein